MIQDVASHNRHDELLLLANDQAIALGVDARRTDGEQCHLPELEPYTGKPDSLWYMPGGSLALVDLKYSDDYPRCPIPDDGPYNWASWEARIGGGTVIVWHDREAGGVFRCVLARELLPALENHVACGFKSHLSKHQPGHRFWSVTRNYMGVPLEDFVERCR